MLSSLRTRLLVTGAAAAAAARPSEVLAFARRGPLWRQLRASPLAIKQPTAEEWVSHGEALTQQLLESAAATPALSDLDAAVAIRVYHLYLPIYFWARAVVREQQGGAGGHAGAVSLGLSAPQGCGKTTLVDFLIDRFAADGLNCAAVSFDDFYLTGAAQDALAARHPDNPLWQVRGTAGTHDLALGTATLASLRDAATSGGPARLPRYDKSARGGRGDRAPPEAWAEAARPVDVVLLEGWMAGFAPVAADAAVLTEHAGLADVNEQLGEYRAWHEQMDAWVVLAVDRPDVVYTWRLQASTGPV